MNSNLQTKDKFDFNVTLINNSDLRAELEKVSEINKLADKIDIIRSSNFNNNILMKMVDKNSGLSTSKSKHSYELLYENKFLDINWQVFLESCSSEISEINQLKVSLNIKYLDSLTLEIKELNLILSEEEFNNFLDEISKLQKYFN